MAKPDGLLVVPPEGELAFLHPLPVQRLWGVGPKTTAKLHQRGLTTVGQVAMVPERLLISMLGAGPGRHLHALAHNHDPRPVVVGRRRRSIGSQRALGRGRRSAQELDFVMLQLVDRVTGRLRAAGRLARTVVIRLRFDDFTRASRSHTLDRPTADTRTILTAARALMDAAAPLIERQGCTLVGLALTNLADHDAVQLSLPFDARSSGALDAVLDELRDRYGASAVTRATQLGRDQGLSMPVLPD